jgi:NADH-quinone oxidoreductase subunit E
MFDNLARYLSLDALLFFGTHSLLVVAICAVTFFTIGLWVGYLTWAKFQRRARAYFEEIQLQRSEIAHLKRRIAEESVESLQPPTLGLLETKSTVTPQPDVPLKSVIPTVIAPKRESLADTVIKRPRQESALGRPLSATVIEAEIAPSALKSTASLVQESRASAPTTIFPSKLSPAAIFPESTADEPIPVGELETKPAEAQPAVRRQPQTRSLTQAIAKSVEDASRRIGSAQQTPHDNNGSDIVASAESPNDLAAGLRDGKAANDEKLGVVYHKRPERCDDLTLLRGVGDALQTKLHELGIFTFRQIAQWSDEIIHEFDVRLAAKDRIRREQWVKQARNLHFLKYGEQLKSPISMDVQDEANRASPV